MRRKILGVIGGIALLGLPSLGLAQSSTDISELKQFVTETENQGAPPAPGTKITMANWQQYKAFLPFGMTKLFQGGYQLKMPADVEIDIGETKIGGNLLPTFLAATEKYSGQNSVSVTPDGHYDIQNYQGGIPFPNPTEPHKGWKALANVFFAYQPAIVASTPENTGAIWFADRFGNISEDTFDLVYRQSGYNTDPGIPKDENYAPGTWSTQWFMEETPEQARYTASLAMFFKDQEAHPFPDQYVFVPALRRSLRLSTSARCAPIFGSDWANDDAKLNGFNGSTSIYDAEYLSDRKEVELLDPAMDKGYSFPNDYFMPLGFPKPDWGAWQVRPAAVIDVHRIPSEASGYCYGDRVMYLDKEVWQTYWNDNFDSNHKLWKVFAYENAFSNDPALGHTWTGIAAMAWDVQNTHMTIWSSWANPAKKGFFLDTLVPGEYRNGVKYGSPSGLMQIER